MFAVAAVAACPCLGVYRVTPLLVIVTMILMNEPLVESVHWPAHGRYVLAVSGGVDSMTLLDVLSRHGRYDVVVAHCNHGIRPDSDSDEELVATTAQAYGLPFRSTRLQLSSASSEAQARHQRYEFLQAVCSSEQSHGLITAHHLDDRVETMVLNRRRGAGWLGLAPLRQTARIKRPFLGITKAQIIEYASTHAIPWRQDATNLDPGHTARNRLRQQLSLVDRQQLYEQLAAHDKHRDQRERVVRRIMRRGLGHENGTVTVAPSRLLAEDVATCRDVLYFTLKTYFATDMEIDFGSVVRLEHFYKTATPNQRLRLSEHVWVLMGRDGMVIYAT